MRLRDLILTAVGLASAYALRARLGRFATRATGTWVGRPR
jgi:hypothetical protein